MGIPNIGDPQYWGSPISGIQRQLCEKRVYPDVPHGEFATNSRPPAKLAMTTAWVRGGALRATTCIEGIVMASFARGRELIANSPVRDAWIHPFFTQLSLITIVVTFLSNRDYFFPRFFADDCRLSWLSFQFLQFFAVRRTWSNLCFSVKLPWNACSTSESASA